jgi:hypothetical protein
VVIQRQLGAWRRGYHLGVPARDRQHRDHPSRPRTTNADDPGHRQSYARTLSKSHIATAPTGVRSAAKAIATPPTQPTPVRRQCNGSAQERRMKSSRDDTVASRSDGVAACVRKRQPHVRHGGPPRLLQVRESRRVDPRRAREVRVPSRRAATTTRWSRTSTTATLTGRSRPQRSFQPAPVAAYSSTRACSSAFKAQSAARDRSEA